MQRLFFLRAFGDFVIGIQAVSKSEGKFKVIASNHLSPLYNALLSENVINPVDIEFVDFGITKGQLNFFTNKHFISVDNWRQIQKIKTFIKYHPNHLGIDYLEQDKRLYAFNLFTNGTFQPIVNKNIQVYSAYQQFTSTSTVSTAIKKELNPLVVIFPDARQVKKELSLSCIAEITKQFEERGTEVKLAKWNYDEEGENTLTYNNFNELIRIIQQSDFIVSADSLPVHLAQALNKPHLIVYNKKMNRFCTPYATMNHSFQIGNK